MKMAPIKAPKSIPGIIENPYFSRPRLFCRFYVELYSLWAPFWYNWSPLGSLLAPFWLPLAHFWLPLAHFWLPLAHFWLPLAPFWLTFGIPWLTFGALCFTFAHPGLNFLTFAVSCLHFSYLFEFYMKISCKIWFLQKFFSLSREALASSLVGLTEACLLKKAEGEGLTIDRLNFENHILGRSSRIFPKRIERTTTESRSSLVTHPSRARSGTFASGNLD